MFWLARNMKAEELSVRRISDRIKPQLFMPVFFAIMLVAASPARSFDLPDYDPWYYQSHGQGYLFLIPDKAQHFYGSAAVNECAKQLPLPGIRILGPVLSLTAGFMYEVYQDQKGIGFSERDMLADALGIAASQFSTEQLTIWLDYSPTQQVIMFRVAFLLED